MWIRRALLLVGCLSGLVFGKEPTDKPFVGSSAPALAPAEAEKKFKVPDGFEVRLFAAEPDVVNPVAMCFDEKGRLWVVELYEYPNGAKPGTKGRDRVKVLEDTDGDGKADKVTVFCDGLSLATAVQVGNGGVFVGQAPYLYFYPIVSDGPDGPKAGERKTLLTGFGLDDRHELINDLTWGPDGWLYFTQGVFTHSLVKDPENPKDPGVKLDACVGRYNTRTRKVEVFADGISNQWGVDWDRAGNAFVSACVVEHIWHAAPGGVYQRQGGQPNVPYTYELLKSINKDKHRHYMAAYGGINIYQGNLFPAEYRGTVFMGNIHGNCIDHDQLMPDGASFTATDLRKGTESGEFLEANDDWFRPVSEQVGPDGALWIMDWYDKYPCYQNSQAPDLDRERGRVWRVVYTGKDNGRKISVNPTGDLGKMSDEQLVGLLSHDNIWQRRVAQRLLTERKAKVSASLTDLLRRGTTLEARLAALWTLNGINELAEGALEMLAGDREPAIRAWAARITGERGEANSGQIARLTTLAADADPHVRSFVAYASRRLAKGNTLPIISKLLEQAGTDSDPILPFMIWMAAESKIGDDASALSEILGDEPKADAAKLAFIHKGMHRIADTRELSKVWDGLEFLGELANDNPALCAAGLDGLLEVKQGIVPRNSDNILPELQKSRDRAVADRATRLAAAWGNVEASLAMLQRVNDASASEEERISAIRVAREFKGDEARAALLAALQGKNSEKLKMEAIRGLSELGSDEAADFIIKDWSGFSPENRRAVAEVMATRLRWGSALLNGVKQKTVVATDIPLTAARAMSRQRDKAFLKLMGETIGAFRESPEAKLKLIAEKRNVVLNGPVDLNAGHAVMTKTCLVCHKFYGEGAEVGPDLTGVGRSSIDALLANVIDPSQIIGKGYENTIVETKDGRLLTGRLVEDTEDHVKLLSQGPKEDVVARNQISKMRTETNVSTMPEGLEQMPEADFRNLVWYVFSPQQDEKQKRIAVEMHDKQIAVRAKMPGSDKMVELLTYVIDPNLRPFFHPVRDPAGEIVLTEDRPADHPWQHGIFAGLHEVNGLDFWTEKAGPKIGSQHFVKLLDLQATTDRVSWRALSQWKDPAGVTVLDEEQAVVVYAPESSQFYRIDLDWTLRAHDKSVDIGKYDFGGLSVRMPFDPRHIHLNSNGERDAATGNKSATWCDVSRPFGEKIYGIAVLDHPKNLGYPSMWRVDGQGMINPSPSLRGDWRVEESRARTFRYRLVVHQGPADAHILNGEQAGFGSIKVESSP